MHRTLAPHQRLNLEISKRKWVAIATRTNSAHDGDSEPIQMLRSQSVHVTEAIPEGCKHVMGNKHRLHEFDDIDAIDEIFYKSSFIRKCQIV